MNNIWPIDFEGYIWHGSDPFCAEFYHLISAFSCMPAGRDHSLPARPFRLPAIQVSTSVLSPRRRQHPRPRRAASVMARDKTPSLRSCHTEGLRTLFIARGPPGRVANHSSPTLALIVPLYFGGTISMTRCHAPHLHPRGTSSAVGCALHSLVHACSSKLRSPHPSSQSGGTRGILHRDLACANLVNHSMLSYIGQDAVY